MIKRLYCYCIGGEVIHGPMPLPPPESPISNCPFLNSLSDEELRPLGWLPWVFNKRPDFDFHRFRLFSTRKCTEFFSYEQFYVEPITEEEYLLFYEERLNTIPTNTRNL